MLSTDLTDDAHHVVNLGDDHFMSRSSALGTLLFLNMLITPVDWSKKPQHVWSHMIDEQGLIQHGGHTGSRPV